MSTPVITGREVSVRGLGLEIWREVTEEFGRRRGRVPRDLWLRAAKPLSFRRGLFTLSVDDAAAKAAIEASYAGDLEGIFQDITGSPVRVRICVGSGDDAADARGVLSAAAEATEPAPSADQMPVTRTRAGGPRARHAPLQSPLPFVETE